MHVNSIDGFQYLLAVRSGRVLSPVRFKHAGKGHRRDPDSRRLMSRDCLNLVIDLGNLFHAKRSDGVAAKCSSVRQEISSLVIDTAVSMDAT